MSIKIILSHKRNYDLFSKSLTFGIFFLFPELSITVENFPYLYRENLRIYLILLSRAVICKIVSLCLLFIHYFLFVIYQLTVTITNRFLYLQYFKKKKKYDNLIF